MACIAARMISDRALPAALKRVLQQFTYNQIFLMPLFVSCLLILTMECRNKSSFGKIRLTIECSAELFPVPVQFQG